MKNEKTPFNVMIKPCGPRCNLACEYCYYIPKTNLYPDSDYKLSLELLEIFMRQMIDAQPGKQVEFVWQGGEPTLIGLDYFQKAIELQKHIAPSGMRITNIIQTNATRLTTAWCEFFSNNNFLVGVSLDGPERMHDIFRHDQFGNGSHKQVMRAIDLLKQSKVNFNILCCVSQANINYPLEIYLYLRDTIGAQFIQFIPIVQRKLNNKGEETQEISANSVDGYSYGKFLNVIFDEWVTHDVGETMVQIFEVALGLYMGLPASLCVFAKTCGRALVLEHNGDLYSCDHFVNKENLLGNIKNAPLVEMVESQKQKQFGKNKSDLLPQICLECDFRFVCNGGCPKNRVERLYGSEEGLNYLCNGYKSFFSHIDTPMRIMTTLLRSGRTASDIMRMSW